MNVLPATPPTILAFFPVTFPPLKSSTTDTQRRNSSFENLRHIVWRGYMEADQTYYMKLKSVLDSDQREFYMDMLELCPKEVYDNPEKPEDIW